MRGSATLYADSCVQIVDWSVYIQDVLQTLLVLVGWMFGIEFVVGAEADQYQGANQELAG